MSLYLLRVQDDLRLLKAYLVSECELSPKRESVLRRTRLVLDPEQIKFNKQDPRAFCFVKPGEQKIFTCPALEALPVQFRLGVLLHELGHLVIPAIDGPESEVDVDAWLLRTIPEAGYHYANTEYTCPLSGHDRFAENLESVSQSFVRELHG